MLDIRQTIENNPIIYVVGTAVTVATIAVGIVGFFATNGSTWSTKNPS